MEVLHAQVQELRHQVVGAAYPGDLAGLAYDLHSPFHDLLDLRMRLLAHVAHGLG